MIPSDALRTTELLALIEEATAPVRHDVRNRIASMRNLAFFVRRKLGSEANVDRDPRVTEFLLKIEGEVSRTDEVIDAWSTRVQAVRPLELSPIRVGNPVRLAIECARLPPGAKLTLAPLAEEPLVEVDELALALAVRCLLENAAEAEPAASVNVRIDCVEDSCHIVVVDRGPGIADRARALERFETTKPGHLGLGLCMARRIATRFGGDLAIFTPDKGTEVSLRIPVAAARTTIGAAP